MKRYYVTVNGNRYEVEIEEVRGEFSPRVAAAPTVSLEPKVEVASQAQAPIKEKPKQEIKEAPKPVGTAAGGEKIECPMPGTILKVNITEGASIKKGDVMFILEAMKMENEIMAPRDGKVVKVDVAKGSAVNTGDVLATIE